MDDKELEKPDNSRELGKAAVDVAGNFHPVAAGAAKALDVADSNPLTKGAANKAYEGIGKALKETPGGKRLGDISPDTLNKVSQAASLKSGGGKSGGGGAAPGKAPTSSAPGSKGSGSEIVSGMKNKQGNQPAPVQASAEAEIDSGDSSESGGKNKSGGSDNSDSDASGDAELKKKKKIVIPIVLLVFFGGPLFILLVLSLTFISSFSSFFGLFSLNSDLNGEVGGLEFTEVDPEVDAFVDRVQQTINNYDDVGIDAEVIVSTFVVLKNEEGDFDYSDITSYRIKSFIDLSIDENGRYNFNVYKENLNAEFKKYLPRGYTDEEVALVVDKVEEHIDDYYSFIGLDGENGGACNVNTSTQSSYLAGLSSSEFISTMGPIAQANVSFNHQDGQKMYASVLLAQMIEESGWGRSDLSVNHNNMFGIKCHGYPTCADYNTREEYTPGSSSYVSAGFRSYPDVEASMQDRYNFLAVDNTRYVNAGFFKASSPQAQIQTLKDAGYATSSSYVNNLNSIISTYNLEEWDTNVNSCTSASAQYDIRTVAPTAADLAFTYKSSNRGQCVWYAQARAIEAALDLSTKGIIDSGTANRIKDLLLNTYGNGGDWYNVSSANGYFQVSNDVNAYEAGAIISWSKPGGYGHVAFIEDVNQDDGTITITEGWADNTTSCPSHWGCVNFLSRTITIDEYLNKFGPTYKGNYVFSGYIYPLKLLS